MGASAAGAAVKLALDNHYSPVIARKLRQAGHDVLAIVERGWERESDHALLELCAQEHRALLTNNVADFVAISRTWTTEGRRHGGLVFTSDASMPRGRNTIGRYVAALAQVLAERRADDALCGQVHWL